MHGASGSSSGVGNRRAIRYPSVDRIHRSAPIEFRLREVTSMRLSLVASALAVLLCGSVPASAALVTYTQAMGGFTHNSDTVNAGFNAALGGGYTHLSFSGASSNDGGSYSTDVTFSTSTGIFGGPNSPNVNFDANRGDRSVRHVGRDPERRLQRQLGVHGRLRPGRVQRPGGVHPRVRRERRAARHLQQLARAPFSLWGVQATAGEHIGRIELDGNFFGIQDIEYSQVNVPEPVSMVLLGLGLVGVAARRRRKL